MVAATFQKEKDAAEKDEFEAAIEKDNLYAVAVTPKDVDKQMRKDEPEIIPPHELSSSRMSLPTNWQPTPVRRAKKPTPHPKCVSNSAALAASKLCMVRMTGSTTMSLSQA
jgi:hypothetical protein